MDWIDVGSIDLSSNSFSYAFGYLIFSAYASPEEKSELVALRDQFNGDNHQALACMYARLRDRQVKNELKQEEQEKFKRNELFLKNTYSYQGEYKAEYKRWKAQNISIQVMEEKRIHKKDEDLTPEDVKRIFDEPILRTVTIDENINIEVHDKLFGCYTLVYNDTIRSGYERKYSRIKHIDDVMSFNNIFLHNLKDDVRRHHEKMKKLAEEERIRKAEEAKIAPILAEAKEWQEIYEQAKPLTTMYEQSTNTNININIYGNNTKNVNVNINLFDENNF